MRGEFIMIDRQTNKIIDIIKTMNEKDKLRLAIALSGSDFSNINFDKKEILVRADKRLREIDEEYRITIVNFSKYNLVMYTMTKIVELESEKQNKVALVLFNSIKN